MAQIPWPLSYQSLGLTVSLAQPCLKFCFLHKTFLGKSQKILTRTHNSCVSINYPQPCSSQRADRRWRCFCKHSVTWIHSSRMSMEAAAMMLIHSLTTVLATASPWQPRSEASFSGTESSCLKELGRTAFFSRINLKFRFAIEGFLWGSFCKLLLVLLVCFSDNEKSA